MPSPPAGPSPSQEPSSGGDSSAGSPRIGLSPRHVRRVGGEHVGQRVSLRRWVDDPERGPVQSDVVGRLLAYTDEVLLLVDRRHQLHVVDAARILSSRVVPPHPRMEDEPHVGTRDAPLERDAARVLLLDTAERVLLITHVPAPGREVWTAPGGGLRPDEDHVTAARRELEEEVGLEVEPGAWVWSRAVTFPFHGVWVHQRERWFLARGEVDPATAPLDDVALGQARWWSVDDLAASEATTAPGRLAEHLGRLLAEGPPDEPIDVGV